MEQGRLRELQSDQFNLHIWSISAKIMVIRYSQHGFVQKNSCVTSLFHFMTRAKYR